jgi:hypothetical protein
MMKRRHIRKLTVERERTFIFRSHAVVQAEWCKQCSAEVELITVAEAAREIGLGELAAYRLIEAGDLHFTQKDDVNILVCLNSLRRIQRKLEADSTTDELTWEGKES